MASSDEARRRDEVLEALQRDLEAARYAEGRARKQYDASDPENRLVAAELEQRWNQALERGEELEDRIARHGAQALQEPPPRLEDFETLAEDLEVLTPPEPLSRPPPRQGTIGCEITAVRQVGRARRPLVQPYHIDGANVRI